MYGASQHDLPPFMRGALERIAREAEELRNREYQPYIPPEFAPLLQPTARPARGGRPSRIPVSVTPRRTPPTAGRRAAPASPRRAPAPAVIVPSAAATPTPRSAAAPSVSIAPDADAELRLEIERLREEILRGEDFSQIPEEQLSEPQREAEIRRLEMAEEMQRLEGLRRPAATPPVISAAEPVRTRPPQPSVEELIRNRDSVRDNISRLTAQRNNIAGMANSPDIQAIMPSITQHFQSLGENINRLTEEQQRYDSEIQEASRARPRRYVGAAAEAGGAAPAERRARRPFELPEVYNARLAPIPQDMLSAMTLGRETRTYAPHMNMATQHAGQATQPFPAGMQAYMNPYQQAVVDRIRQEGLRTLREGILPELEGKFIGAGHHGSSRHRGLSERVSREMLNEITGHQAKALSRGFSESAQIHAADKARQLQAARELAHIGSQKQAGRLADIGALENQARYLQNWDQLRRNMAFEQYQREENAPWEALERQSALMHGMPYGALTAQRSYELPAQSTYVPSTMGNIGQLAGQLYGLSRMQNP